MENTLSDRQICVITVAFPTDNDGDIMDLTAKIKALIEPLPKVKVETRIVFQKGELNG